jgi:hypothetical protein
MLVYGYFVIGGFGTFAVYLPELFPTRVRATGPGFRWNAARSVTAVDPLIAGRLVAEIFPSRSWCGRLCLPFGRTRRLSGKLSGSVIAPDCQNAINSSRLPVGLDHGLTAVAAFVPVPP